MKQLIYTFIILSIVVAGCTKDEKIRTTGTDTIDNVRHYTSTWIVYGFSFSTGKLVSSEATPKPDIIVDTITSVRPNVYLQGSANTYFSKVADYATEASAQAAFDALKTITATTWVDWANPIMPNQIWIFRSGADTYTKIRIARITQRMEQGIPVAEVTFQWVHQPDGSLTFP